MPARRQKVGVLFYFVFLRIDQKLIQGLITKRYESHWRTRVSSASFSEICRKIPKHGGAKNSAIVERAQYITGVPCKNPISPQGKCSANGYLRF